MGKKIILLVFTCITLAGLVLTVTGFAMGGYPSNITVRDGQILMRAGGEEKVWGYVPWWGRGGSSFSDSKQNDENDYDAPKNSRMADVPSPASVGEFAGVENVDIDITAGYVTIKTGDTPGIVVDGPMEYSSKIVEGEWEISAKYSVDDIRAEGGSWEKYPRFFRAGLDVTTYFTITLPKTITDVEADLSMGTMEIEGLVLQEGEFETDMGALKLNNCNIDKSSLQVNMGSIVAKNIITRECSMDGEMGSIDFEGNITGILDAKCTMGSIKINVPRPERFGYNVETSLGSVAVDGKKHNGVFRSGSERSDENILPFYDLSCDLGSIALTFK